MGYRMKSVILGIVLCIMFPVMAYGNEDYSDLSDYDFSDIQEILDEEGGVDFEETVKQIMSGEDSGGTGKISEIISSTILYELEKEKDVIIKVLLIGLAAAMFSNISGAILNGKISETGFYITYLSLVVALTAGYSVIASMVTRTMELLIELMGAFVPVYIVSIGFSTGSNSAEAFYRVIVVVITLIEKILLKVIIPMIYMYLITNIINNMADGKLFSKTCELIKTIVDWMLKGLLSFVIGINLIRGLINPIVDSIKMGTWGKVLSGIPGIGGALNSVSGIVLASGTLIKNAIGIGGVVAIAGICFVPVIKALIVSLAYKLSGAMLEPVSDKRVVNSINSIYVSIVLLMKTLLYAVVFFLLTIAVICSSTNYNIS